MFGKIFCLGIIFSAGVSQAQALYKLNGKPVELKDLNATQQQQYFEFQFESFEKTRMLVDQSLFEQYVAEQAKKTEKNI